MKARELKPLDWVAYLGSYYQINFAGGDIMYLVGKKDYVPTSELSPIILTEEILEKNGWKKRFDYECGNAEYYKYSNNDICLHETPQKSFEIKLINTKTLYITTVHQLQHLLWTFGMDDDLKI